MNLFLVGSMLTPALLAYQTPHIDTQLVKCVTYQAGEALLVGLFLLIKSEFQLFLPIWQNSISHTPDQLVEKMKNKQSHIESWRPCNVKMTSLCHVYIAAQRMQELLEAFLHVFIILDCSIWWWERKIIHYLCEVRYINLALTILLGYKQMVILRMDFSIPPSQPWEILTKLYVKTIWFWSPIISGALLILTH